MKSNIVFKVMNILRYFILKYYINTSAAKVLLLLFIIFNLIVISFLGKFIKEHLEDISGLFTNGNINSF